ncbi:MAG: hypothetical protein LBP31_02345 [Holosporales bacterium]|jgi:hypothetical protein|nr:hypothetical protein [Holosporales bacterium]
MEIFQKDILGGGISINSEKSKKFSEKSESAAKKEYKPITIYDGIDEKHAEANAMLIHRFLQKKTKNKNLLIKLLKNEMNIKNGKMEVTTAVRDSLLSVFVMK